MHHLRLRQNLSRRHCRSASPPRVHPSRTDGITEAANIQAEELGNERIIESLRSSDGMVTALATQRKIMEDVTKYCASNFHDDATVLVAAIQ